MSKLKQKLMSNFMIRTLFSLEGNGKSCIWLEPLWGIPYNLYLPYVALFMTALGLSPAEIGYVASINMVSQVVFATLSGVLTDKLGRRRATLIFDTLSWSVPELIWMCSQNFTWFAVAAVFNGAWRVTENSWGLLLIEDMPQDQIVPAFSLTQMMGLLAAFFAPLSKFAVDAFGLVPTMRVLYGITAVSMTTKFVTLYIFSTETRTGVRRMEAVKHKSIFRLLWECKDVYLRIIREKRMVLTFGIIAAYTLVSNLNGNYWALFVCGELGLAESNVVLFSTLKSLVTLGCVFLLVPRVQRAPFRASMLSGLAMFAGAQLLLLVTPAGAVAVPLLVIGAVLEAVSLSILSPLTGSLLFINADPEERARVCGLVYATISLIVAIFPGLIGRLADISIRIPFVISLGLFAFTAVLTVIISRLPAPEQQ